MAQPFPRAVRRSCEYPGAHTIETHAEIARDHREIDERLRVGAVAIQTDGKNKVGLRRKSEVQSVLGKVVIDPAKLLFEQVCNVCNVCTACTVCDGT